MTQKQLGDKCGLADSAIRRYELGGANPKIETIEKIANALEVDIAKILDITPVSETPYSDTSLVLKSVEDGCFLYTRDEAKTLIEAIRSDMQRTEDDFSLCVKYSHKIVHDMLDKYATYDITDIADLLGAYLRLNESGQNKVIQYAYDLLETKSYSNSQKK